MRMCPGPSMKHVLVYTSSTCSACRTVKEFLVRHQVEFEERSLDDPRWLEQLADTYEVASAPSVVVDGVLVSGSLPEIAEAVGLKVLGRNAAGCSSWANWAADGTWFAISGVPARKQNGASSEPQP
jgi:glutaredoxin